VSISSAQSFILSSRRSIRACNFARLDSVMSTMAANQIEAGAAMVQQARIGEETIATARTAPEVNCSREV
jgi:hypothetical protein